MNIQRMNVNLIPNNKRVLLRPFNPVNKSQSMRIFKRIVELSEEQVDNELNDIIVEFGARHKNMNDFFSMRFDQISKYLNLNYDMSKKKKLLIGAYFSMEYSVESAALFNPSLVWHPDQKNLPQGARRFIMSLRATGEGHISSIVFRTGSIDKKLQIQMDGPGRFIDRPISFRVDANEEYTIKFDEKSELAERILFPASLAEKNGTEDARFLLFTDENGSQKYYATYTAFDGMSIRSQMIETPDFTKFHIRKLAGAEIQNKGMALFPRKVNGRYAMLSRQDNENNYIMFSDDLYTWNSKQFLLAPEYGWEFIQIGNCGSPIETDAGWLVLSHGVGAMRKYSISAFLLDIDNPARVIGTLEKPLIYPNEQEREGYVPNVVYSCGGIVYENTLILPYAMSDYASTIAIVNLEELLNELIS
ncbi:glycoside hydrolase family 130 protein [candidate division KSB1 bacterium]|nr:glycoside hydrolase family 130 protein [candidate division KSB1 bacterium]RQW10167.1 MAG: glycosidase [candidate division KSB1 bacterium]